MQKYTAEQIDKSNSLKHLLKKTNIELEDKALKLDKNNVEELLGMNNY